MCIGGGRRGRGRWVGGDNGGCGCLRGRGFKGVARVFGAGRSRGWGGGRGNADFSLGRTNFQGSLLRLSAARSGNTKLERQPYFVNKT